MDFLFSLVRKFCIFELLHTLSGLRPSDASTGFLPPNNGTSGQGFLQYSIMANRNVSHLARIDAEASIIFDTNAPIDTPPIFNTVS